MSIATTVRGAVLLLVLIPLTLVATPAHAAGETFKVLSVNTTGCDSGNFGMTVERAGLDGGNYIVRTVATVDDLVYMNEEASISVNGTTGWNLFDTFTYGAVPNPGTWPIPQNKQLHLQFTLERPKGTVLHDWTLVVDGCNTGNVLYNDLTASDADGDFVAVPTDRCGTLAADRANGCPLVARSLALAYSGKRLSGFLLADGSPVFQARRPVTVWKVRPGPDKKIVRRVTTATGFYAVPGRPAKGRYYATSPGLIRPTQGQVTPDTSGTVRVR